MKITTALITPFYNGNIDYNSLDRLLELQSNAHIDQVVVLGTTAESTLLSQDEKLQLLRYIKLNTYDKFSLMVGVGSCSTRETVYNAIKACESGADSLLVVTPYYSKYTLSGLMHHFEAIRECTDKNIVLYNVPHRTSTPLSIDTIRLLCSAGLIDAVKECSENISLVHEIQCHAPGLTLYCGNDSIANDMRCIGVSQAISVISNFAPISSQTSKYLQNGELTQILGMQPSPVVAKYICYKLGIIASPEMRLPLTPPTTKQQKIIDQYTEENRGNIL